MNMRLAIVALCAVSASACAENLPPVNNTGTYPPQTIKPPTPMPSINTLNQMMNRMEQMQKEIQQLTGRVEDQVFLIAELKKQQKTQYADFDERLQALENKAITPPADAEAIPPDASAVPPPIDAATPATDVAPSDPAVATDAGASAPTAAEATPVPDPVPQTAPKAVSADAAISATEEEKQEYKQAYNQLSIGQTDEAITSFDAYLLKYPGGGYASNVQYWLGEAYRVKQDTEAAKAAFNKVIDRYPASPKVPDALLKLGYIEIEQNNTVQARDYLTRISKDYPSSNAAYLASKKLATLTDVKP